MQYLRNLARSTYESYIEDEYIQKLKTEEIYQILQIFSSRRKILTSAIRDDLEQPQEVQQFPKIVSILEDDYEIRSVFKRLQKDYKLEEIQQLIRMMKDNLDNVKSYICYKHPEYLDNLQGSLKEVDGMVEQAHTTRPKLAILRQTLKRLEESRKKSEQVVGLRIKVGNIKNLVGLISQMPNLNKMRTRQLRQLKIPNTIKELHCYESLDSFLQSKIEQQNEQTISDIKNILECFNSERYTQILKGYYELGSVSASLDKLILGIARESIKQFDIDVYDLCNHYVKFMMNFHLICRWHFEYDPESNMLPKEASQQLKGTIFQMKRKIWIMMEQHLQHILSELIDIDSNQLFQLTCQLNRFIEIGQNFGGIHIGKISEELYLKSLSMVHSTIDNGLATVTESLSMEESFEWSRLPVDNQYKSQHLQNTILQIRRQCELPAYKEFLRNNLCYIDEKEPRVDNPDEDWHFKKFKLELPTDAVRLRRLVTAAENCQVAEEVVICQSVLPVLKFYEKSCNQLFHLRLTTQNIINSMFTLTSSYIFYVYSTFIPSSLKNLAMSEPNQPQDIYQKERFEKKYPTLCSFLRDYTSKIGPIKQSQQKKKMLRSRVVSIETFRYIVIYLSYCFRNLKPCVKSLCRFNKKIDEMLEKYGKLQNQLSQLLYSECIVKIAETEYLLNPLTKIKWEDDVDLDPLRLKLQIFMKDFNNKLRGLSKGEIPAKIIDRIFLVFCKHMANSLTQTYLKIRKMSSKGRQLVRQLLNKISTEMSMFFNGEKVTLMDQLKDIIIVTDKDDIEGIMAFLKEQIGTMNIPFRDFMQIIAASKWADMATKGQIQKKQAQVLQIVKGLESI